MTLKNTWKWWPLAVVVGTWAGVLGMSGVDSDFIEYTAALAAEIAYAAVVQFRFRVTLTGEGIAVRAWRHRFIPRHEFAAIEVRRSFGGRRLTVIRTDGTTARLPVPRPRDQRWNEMLHEIRHWAANA